MARKSKSRARGEVRSVGDVGGMSIGAADRGRYPVDNLTYDVITILHEKSKALEAYDKYLQDARGDDDVRRLLEQIREQDVRMVHDLRRHLGRLLQEEGSRGRRAA